MNTWRDAPNKTVDVNGTPFTYRELGPAGDVPVVCLPHFTAVLDDWDPRVIDGIASERHVIVFDNRGIGSTGGTAPDDLEKMGADAIEFIRALGLSEVDLFGFSIGGAVAQMVALQAPGLVRRMILAGTGPRGGGGIDRMRCIVGGAYLKALLTRQDPRNFLFFPRTKSGKVAARAYLQRIKEREQQRDRPIAAQARGAQLRAIVGGGRHAPDDLSVLQMPVLVANGDHDVMVASELSADLAQRLPNAQLTIYPDSGHAGVFQHYEKFVPVAVRFLSE